MKAVPHIAIRRWNPSFGRFLPLLSLALLVVLMSVLAIGADSVKLPAGASVRDSHDDLSTNLAHPAHTPGYRVTGSTD